MRLFVAFPIAISCLYLWDDEHNRGKLIDGLRHIGAICRAVWGISVAWQAMPGRIATLSPFGPRFFHDMAILWTRMNRAWGAGRPDGS